MNRINWKSTAVCVSLSAALMLASCAPAAQAAVYVYASRAPVTAEEDSLLALELEQSLTEKTGIDDEVTSPAMTDNGVLLDLSQAVHFAAVSSLSIPQTFAVTRPSPSVTTTYDKYFITGTSDPDQPVYYGNAQIQRLGSKGTFGVLVPLQMGINTFTFSQNGKQETVTITRTAVSDPSRTPITTISSAVPTHMSGVKVGEALSVGCIAPSGATVKASFDGKTVTLKQAETTVSAGLPAAFTGKITIGTEGYDADVTQEAGKVTYLMTYKGSTKEYSSDGFVYVAGENSRIAIEVAQYLGFVYPKTSDLSVFKEVVKKGARDYIAGQSNEYFELASGGFIPKQDHVKIVTGKVGVQNSLSSVTFNKGTKSESITFHGTCAPFYDTSISNDVFYIRMYNTTGTPGASISGGKLFSSGKGSESDKGYVTYQFPMKGLVWGYDVSFDGGDTTLTLKYKPTPGSGSTPLKGLTVMLDPGHGGKDPGALGVAGAIGPSEADVNLANALATKEALEALGATVRMTRSDDKYVSLDTRLEWIEYAKADLFISIHHNSIGENVDANKVSGMEVYYHTAHSQKFASGMMSCLASGLNRNNRLVSQSYYRVTLSPYAPALLVELGFMSNPVEYEKATSSSEMQKVADAVANGIISVLK